MKSNNRLTRINDEIMRELSQIIRMELKDPRISTMTSVMRAETTPDLKYCKVYISVLGNEEEKQSVMTGMENAKGFMRHLLAERINLRFTPELIFKLDDSVEYSVRMNKLIDEVTKSLHDTGDGDNDE